MRAVRIPRHGGPEVLTLEELPTPRPGPGEVTVDVAYAGVTFADAMYRRGTAALDRVVTPGIEVSGRVREIGEGVDGIAPGGPVAGLSIVDLGGYAETVALDARLVAPLPRDDDDLLRTAAGTPSNTTTAVMALRRSGRLEAGEVLLVHAAASGLGTQLGQVAATLAPAKVIGTVGHPDKIGSARRCGFDPVLLRDEWLADPGAAGRPDLVVDPVGGPCRAASLDLLGPDGRLVAVGNASDGADTQVGMTSLFTSSRTVAGFSLGAISAVAPGLVGRALRQAVDLVVTGRVHVDVNTVLPLEDAVAAHRRVESGATTGKTVLRIGG